VLRTVVCAMLCSEASALHVHRTPLMGRAPALREARVQSTRVVLSEGRAARQQAPALPRSLLPVSLGVFTQMLGEGIAIGCLPLHLTTMGASPVQVGLATSCFSVAQMVCCPFLVALSGRVGRQLVLRVCLTGATASSVLIAASSSIRGIIAARFLAGVFAASVPVAQAAVTDIVPANVTALALSRVSAASQSGVVVGPAACALLMETFGLLGMPGHFRLRAVFGGSAAFALGVLAFSTAAARSAAAAAAAEGRGSGSGSGGGAPATAAQTSAPAVGAPQPPALRSVSQRLTQPTLRAIALIVGWALTLSVSTYGLFAPRFLGYGQPQLSATYSAGAATVIVVQLFLFPRLIGRVGKHLGLTLGLLSLSTGLGGASLCRVQPVHSALYLLSRVGAGIADTATATLVAASSRDKDVRARNLGIIQSTRAGARIVTPLVSGKLFELSCAFRRFPGALPYLAVASAALAAAPAPLVLRRLAVEDRGNDADE